VNLTNNPLTPSQLSLLDLGLSFIPTIPLLLRTDTTDDLQRIIRRLKLFDFFANKDAATDEELIHPLSKLFKIRSGWTPKPHQVSDDTLKLISEMCDVTQNLLNGKAVLQNGQLYTRHHCPSNLTKEQYKALKALRAEDSLILKKADKGNAVVVMETELYRQEALRQLRIEKYYVPLPGPLFRDTARKLAPILDSLRRTGFLTPKQYKHLTPNLDDVGTRYFYILPKIHKAHDAWPHPRMPPGRPIVADVGTESSNICQYIDFFLKPLSTRHPAYLKDTYDFLDKVKGKAVESHWLLFTADVESLYTNMRHDLMVQTTAEAFQEYPDPNRPDWAILELIRIINSNSDFEFDGCQYLQVQGAPMGRKSSPSHADLYLLKLDQKAREGLRGIKPVLYFRFLDDIFGLWPGSREELLLFGEYLNTIIPDIKITLNIREQLVEFLDVRVYKHTDDRGLCTLQTKTYFKPTDTHQLLHRKSFHPEHTFRGIVRSQFIRYKRISSTYEDFQEACTILIRTLRTRGYNGSELRKFKREIWLNWREKRPGDENGKRDEQEVIPVVTYYDKFHCRLNRKWRAKIIANPLFEECRVISAYRRHKNLKDWLVRGRFGNNSADDDPEALLQALVDVIERTEPPLEN